MGITSGLARRFTIHVATALSYLAGVLGKGRIKGDTWEWDGKNLAFDRRKSRRGDALAQAAAHEHYPEKNNV